MKICGCNILASLAFASGKLSKVCKSSNFLKFLFLINYIWRKILRKTYHSPTKKQSIYDETLIDLLIHIIKVRLLYKMSFPKIIFYFIFILIER